ncbi:MAG: transglutaminase family protein [Verrucomicrobiales bacterium]
MLCDSILTRLVVAGALWAPMAGADDSVASLEKVAEAARRSVVTLRQADRADGDGGVGTGFVVGEGRIATNFHVIGEGRAVRIEWPGGAVSEVTGIHAWDRAMDLAVVEGPPPEGRGWTEFPPLPLAAADSPLLADGSPVLAVGAPQGLTASVAQGVLSARRTMDDFPGVSLLQIAMPIEPGNSGGPVLDRDGRVHGIVTLRSQRTANLGFALPASALHVLLAQPNPVPMSRWQTIGALDPALWKPGPGGGVRWSQRAGELRAEGRGTGFGGRALLLSTAPVPEMPYELGVRVRLGDETGAAGLIFGADGGDRHYGFYPTNGSLRLVRFDGPDVFSWTILADVRSDHYQTGEWNDLRVRVASDTIQCFLNGALVIESSDTAWRTGQTGLAQFRQTHPAFRRFRLGSDLTPPPHEREYDSYLREARRMEESAGRFRRLADRTHQASIEADLRRALAQPDGGLLRAALVLARLDVPELEVEAYEARIVGFANEFVASLGPDPSAVAPADRVSRLNEFFFRENGFHGARFDYGNRANSRLPEVFDDREGIPIMLSTLYIEIGRRAGLDLIGLSRPGHFVAGLRPAPDAAVMVIDVFGGGTTLVEPETAALPAATPHDIILRMLNNLQSFARREDDRPAALRYANLAVALDPDDPRLRLARAALAIDQRETSLAADDLERLDTIPLDPQEQSLLERLRVALPPERR